MTKPNSTRQPPAASDKSSGSNRHSNCLICRSSSLSELSSFQRVQLVQCCDCGLVFSPKIPTSRELEAHYQGYNRDISYVSPINQSRIRDILQFFDEYRSTNRILDVGCGVGGLLTQAREEAEWDTFGTEMTDDAIQICRERGHTMHKGPLSPTNYKSESFDIIVYTEVIEHINNQREEFRNVWELLRPGGIVYLTTPNFNSVSRHVLGENWNVIQYPEHLVYFTPATLRKLFSDIGFASLFSKTTGLSISRLKNSILPSSSRAGNKKERTDEKIRKKMQTNPWLKKLKSAINSVLNITGKGDTIKAAFLKSPNGSG